MEKIYLTTTYQEKDQVKSLGAQFDWHKKQWYVYDNDDLSLFQPWLPHEKALPPHELESKTPGKTHYTIRQLKSEIQLAIQQKFPSAIWVVGEVIKLTPKRGHLYLELQDDEALQTINKQFTLRVNLWKNDVERIQTKLHEATGQHLAISQRVRLKIKLEFNPQYDLSGAVTDIDPELTLGQIARQQQLIRDKLIKEGIFTNNKKLPRPIDFCRVAVIHPENASGLHDFQQLSNQLNGLCEFIYLASRFEGGLAQREMVAALQDALHYHQQSPLDGVVIIRGGGARQGLLTLITEDIIRLIAAFPAPVIVGIGHTDDHLLFDEVAKITCGTPSKVIEYIAQTIQAQAAVAHQHHNQLINLAEKRRVSLEVAVLSLQKQVSTTVKNAINLMTHHVSYRLNLITSHSDKQLKAIQQTTEQNHHHVTIRSQQVLMQKGKTLVQINTVLNSTANASLKQCGERLTYDKQLLGHGAMSQFLRCQEKLANAVTTLKDGTFRQQQRLNEKLSRSYSQIELLSPEKTLRRGYCLSIGKKGVIQSVSMAKQEKVFTLRFIDGDETVQLINEEIT